MGRNEVSQIVPKVWNKRNRNVPDDAVYVGRPSKWGNPFSLHHEKERLTVVERYRRWLLDPANRTLVRQACEELRGKDLVCWCAPRACHADVLLEVSNA
jgi:hypothetical protein